MIERRVARIAKLFCLVLLCLAFAAGCLAESSVDPEAAILVSPGENIPNGITIKLQLRDKGYYSSNVPDEIFTSNALDDFTLNALGKLAETYPDKPAYNGNSRGMTSKALWDLQNSPGSIKSISTVEHIGYVEIGMNTEGQSKTIEEIQKRLIDLKYLSRSDASYKPGEASPALFAAMKTFLERNGVAELYDPDVITVPAQEKLLDTDPTLLEPAESKGFLGKIQDYFTGSRPILGMNIPVLVIWFISVMVLAVCVVVFIHFFKSDASGKDAKKPKQSLSQRSKGKPVQFEITYGGVTKTHEQTVDGLLKIGRNVGDFPLNLEDTSISRRHCDLYFQNKKLMLHDYSSGGTFINGEKINNTQRALNSGDVLGIGYHTIKVTY